MRSHVVQALLLLTLQLDSTAAWSFKDFLIGEWDMERQLQAGGASSRDHSTRNNALRSPKSLAYARRRRRPC